MAEPSHHKTHYDVVSYGETMLRLAPTSGRLDEAADFAVYVAGSESNMLTGLARLGLSTAWGSALPQNALGRRVAGELGRQGISTDYILWRPETERLGIFYSEEAPAPLGTLVFYDRAGSAIAHAESEAYDLSAVGKTRLLHLTGITPALSTAAKALLDRLLAQAAKDGTPVSFDVNYRAKLWSPAQAAQAIEAACRQAQVLFVPEHDAAELWGFTGWPEDALKRIAKRFGDEGGEKTIVMTHGAEGASHWVNGQYRHEPASSSDGYHRFGSGDAFCAGYLYAHLGGALYEELKGDDITPLTFGNALAALKRCIAGDMCLVAPDELRSLILKKSSQRFR